MLSSSSSVYTNLRKHTSLFNIRLWILIVISIVIFLLFVIFISLLFICYCCKKSYEPRFWCWRPKFLGKARNAVSSDRSLLWSEIEADFGKHDREIAKRFTSLRSDVESFAFDCPPMVFNSRTTAARFSIREIEVATQGFARESVIGGGDYSIVYRGVLLNNTQVAVKVLLHGGSLENEEFKREVEEFTHVRHKNLVKLLGYCLEGDYRMLVYEYVDNSNLHQWLHGYQGTVSPLAWDTRMRIILGTAKGLAYIHEDIEPRIVHLNVKSSNILLDQQWNPMISDLALARLYDHECSNMTPQHSGYATPEHVSSGILTAKTDVYCFGILIMELITGRPPVDEYQQHQAFLLDWLKSMIADQKTVHVVDSRIPQVPSSKELKRVLLIALRCVDPDADHRPTMGDVVHMLEPRDLLLSDEVTPTG